MTSTNITSDKPAQIDYIQHKQDEETKVTFDISMKERLMARDAITHAKNCKDMPFNVLLTFEFTQDKEHPTRDIKRCRKVCHYLRMYNQRKNDRDSMLIWSRFNEIGTDSETVMILTHVPEKEMESFKQQVSKWKFEKITVELVTGEPDRLRNGHYITAFEDVMKAADKWTAYRNPNIYVEQSGGLRGPRMFCSYKLHKSKLIAHRRQTEQAKQMELFKGFGFTESDLAGNQDQRSYSEHHTPEYK